MADEVKLGGAYVDIVAKNDKLIAGLNTAVSKTEDAAAKMDNALKKVGAARGNMLRVFVKDLTSLELASSEAVAEIENYITVTKISENEISKVVSVLKKQRDALTLGSQEYFKATDAIQNLSDAHNNLINKAGVAKGATEKLSGAHNRLAGSSANGITSLTQFNRIIQDSPYGIIGVTNNIQMFSETFGYLVKSTGSAKAAVGAMLSSLTGAGGIMFAITAVTTALQIYSMQQMYAGDSTDTATDKIKDQLKEIQALIDKLHDLSTSYEEAIRLNNELKDKTVKGTKDQVNALEGQRKAYASTITLYKSLKATSSEAYKEAVKQEAALGKQIDELNKKINNNTGAYDSYVGRLNEARLAAGKGSDAIAQLNMSNKDLGQVLTNLKSRYDELAPSARGYLKSPIDNLEKYIKANNLSSKEEESAAKTREKTSKELLDAQKDFYSQSAILTAEKFRFEMSQLNEEVNAWKAAGVSKFEVEARLQQRLIDLYGKMPARTKADGKGKVSYNGAVSAVQSGNASYNMQPVNVPQIPDILLTDKDQKDWEDQNKFFVDTMQGSLSIINSNFSNLWQGIFGEANSVFEQIAQMIASKLAMQGVGSLLGLIPGVGGFLEGMFKASGGSVDANKPYIVGDAPGGRLTPYSELFVPKSAGTIIPAGQTQKLLSGGGDNNGIKQSLDVLNMNLIQAVNVKSKTNTHLTAEIENNKIRLANDKATKRISRFS